MLENTKYKLTKTADFTVAYFGASLTQGFGAGSYDKTWAGQCTAWLTSAYPTCKITPIDASIGGTGSLFGAYRCEDHVLAFHPDLVFFEFTTNDSADQGDHFLDICNNCDAIIRKIYAKNPYADIVMVYTATKHTSDRLKAGGDYVGRTAHSACAKYYGGIPEIDIGEVLRARVLSEGDDWNKYTVDTTHPNDEGYRIYADALLAHMRALLERAEEIDAPTEKILPKPLFSEHSLFGAHMEDAACVAEQIGFTKVEKSLRGRYPHYMEALAPGATMTHRFRGSKIAVFWMMAKDAGEILVSVDGGAEKRFKAWDTYCKTFNRGCMTPLFDDLQDGDHVLRLRVADEKDGQSEGHAIRIATFCIV